VALERRDRWKEISAHAQDTGCTGLRDSDVGHHGRGDDVSRPGRPRDFTLENANDVMITHVYVAPSDVMSWEEDVLGMDVLAPGATVEITFSGFTEGACSYDIKVIAADGREGYLWAVDLCTVSLVTFS
jgi:hypothetical protein